MTRTTTPILLLIATVTAIAIVVQGQDLPTTYEYFTEGGIQSGLTADQPGFFWLNGKELRIVSGAIHYFRVHPAYWRDRLKKLRATGANTVETYVPWNLHEPERGVFDFGDGGRDFSEFLNVRRYVEIAKEEDLLVLFRPGPYICSEWDLGGLPSWLLRDPDMKARTAYQPYLDRVKIYFDQLLPRVADLQFRRGGSIIGIQIENEYGYFEPKSTEYLEFIRRCYEDNGFGESLPFTSDGVRSVGASGGLPGVLLTSNFQSDPVEQFERMLEIQPNRPLMVMEFWSVWFDHWFEEHKRMSADEHGQILETIFQHNSSVNFYMFHGGTNFGFMAGANHEGGPPHFGADVTSYDYDAPLAETGDYTEKYMRVRELIEQYQVPALARPSLPAEPTKQAYPTLPLQKFLNYYDILARVPASARFTLDNPTAMENLNLNNGNGQGHGYIAYRKVFSNLQPGARLQVSTVNDFGILLLDGQILAPQSDKFENSRAPSPADYWMNEDLELSLDSADSSQSYLIEVLVENMGRINFGDDYMQIKGIPNGGVSVDGVPVTGFQVIALEFKAEWVRGLINWRLIEEAGPGPIKGPAMFQSTFEISGDPADTFLDMRGWHKGVAFVNGFNIGRYFRVGPQQTLFVPAPLLRTGLNTITIFEQLEPGTSIQFSNVHILDQTATAKNP